LTVEIAAAPTTRKAPALFQPADGSALGAVAFRTSAHRPLPVFGSVKPAGVQVPLGGVSVAVVIDAVNAGSESDQRPSPPVVTVRVPPPLTMVTAALAIGLPLVASRASPKNPTVAPVASAPER